MQKQEENFEIQQLKQKIILLEEECQMLEESYNNKINVFIQENERLCESVQFKQQQIDMLQEQLKSQQKQTENNDQQINEQTQNRIEILTNEVDRLNKALEYKSSLVKNQVVKRNSIEIGQIQQQYLKQMQLLNDEVSRLNDIILYKNDEIQKIKQQLNNQNKNNSNQSLGSPDEYYEVTKYEDRLQFLIEEIKKLEIEQMRKQMEKSRTDSDLKNNSNNSSPLKNQQINGHKTLQRQTSFNVILTEMEKLKIENFSLKTDMNQMANDLEPQINNAEQRLNNIKFELQICQNNKKKLNPKNEKGEAVKQQLQTKIQGLTAEIDRLQSLIAKRSNKMQDIKQKVNNYNTLVSSNKKK